jgi:uncharacterized membrane protein
MTRLTPFARVWIAALAAAAGAFCAVVIAAPVAETSGWVIGSWIRLALSPTCHQIADRCLDLGSGPLPVCARCAGLYAGGFVGLAISAVGGTTVRPPLSWLVIAVAPSVVDFAFGLVDLPTLANWPRFAVALVPGLLFGLLVSDAVAEVVSETGRDDVE